MDLKRLIKINSKLKMLFIINIIINYFIIFNNYIYIYIIVKKYKQFNIKDIFVFFFYMSIVISIFGEFLNFEIVFESHKKNYYF